MDLIKTSIKRPVAIIMAMFIVLILGATSITKMKMALTPDMDMPMVIVMTTYEDAGPEEVESLVTEVIEGAIANVENVDGISSTSSEGSSMVMVSFNYGIDLDSAVNSINEKINMVEGMLPDDAGSPTVLKMDMNSMPIAYITITSESVSTNELKTMIEDYIQPRIERQVGVSSVDLTGGKEYEITILVEPERLEGLGLDISTIGQVLASENSNQAGGSVEYGEKQLTISTKLKMASIEEIEKTPIRLTNGTVMQLSEIATIQETEKEVTSISRYNGQECITLSVTMASDGNTVNTVKAVQAEVEKLSADYPNLAVEVTSESGSSIESSILTVVQNIIVGAILSIIILFVFLKNIGLTGIIAISMPLSIVGTFVLLYFSNTTLNLVSLGGLSIGVGMLVDNSVVVLENIYRYRTTEGYSKIKGTYKATKEVGPSIIASTLTTIVVFVPFIFTSGMVTEMMTDLALAVVFSLVMSLVVAITVVPMISGNYVNNVHRNKAPKILGFINVLLSGFDFGLKLINKGYAKLLGWAVRHKKITLALIVAIFCASLTLIPSIGMELMPSSDEGTLTVTVEAPSGSK
ncbi:MAG: efflux RND transporter permease subunit, partial [Anaerotignaceae bacterium]